MAADLSFVSLRPATESENYINCSSKKGIHTVVYGLTLRSSVAMSDSHIKEALHHIFRKVPTLRMCFRRRGDTLWACDMNQEHIDFQVTETQELVPAVEALFCYRFPTTEGPLWCARLLPADAPAHCSRPELAAAFPYTRTLLLANHHGIADGFTNIFVTNVFLRVLDDVVAGKPVDDAAQLGRLVAGEETKAKLAAKKEELMKEEGRLQQLREAMEKSQRETKLIPRVYPMARDPDFKTHIVLRDLDKETTQNFIRRCKEEGVTVNSGLTAVFNVGLVDFVREGGLEQNFYRIHEIHAVNMRRYWSGDTSGTLGVHLVMMATEDTVPTPAKWRDNFWEYARRIHKNITEGLQEKDVMTNSVVSKMDRDSVEDYFAKRPPQMYEYLLSNMGNIDHLIPTEGKQVRLAHLLSGTSSWRMGMIFFFQTLRGCLMSSFIYANDVLTRENAQKLVDKTFDDLLAVMQM